MMHFLSVPKENGAVDKQDKETEIRRLMEAYGDDVLRTSYMFLKSQQSAEDAFQEVFIKVFNKLDSFQGESSEKTWIISITVNVCKDILRSSWIKRILLTDQISSRKSGSNIENKIIRKDENKRLLEEVMALPPVFKEVIILFYYQNYDTAEISKMIKAAEGTVRSRLHRAREILKNKLGGRLSWSE